MLGKLIGQGRTAEIFEYGEDKVVKLFQEGKEYWAQLELANSKLVSQHNIMTPKVYESIEIDNRIGIIYDKIDGIDLGKALGQHLKHIKNFAKYTARIHYKINAVKTQELRSQEAVFNGRITNVDQLDEDKKKIIMDYVKTLPDNHSLCHGDLHIENYIYYKKRIYAIDWLTTYSGHPAGDIARVYLLMNSPSITASLKLFYKLMVQMVIRKYNKAFFKEYFRLTDFGMDYISKFMLPIAAIRLSENIEHEKEWLLGIVDKEINRLGLG